MKWYVRVWFKKSRELKVVYAADLESREILCYDAMQASLDELKRLEPLSDVVKIETDTKPLPAVEDDARWRRSR